ncbi:MAG: TetR/AcrR family transcriptional regulator [Fidelibacterota bacterium]|nr:MAG: TetR/AcrR family transcriptional regulator [Candidatus Neomarinimicrobiota bacterium]
MTPQPESSTTEKSQETYRNILEAAEAAFAAGGFDGANMREIAQAARVNKFMLYYYFGNKETLFLQVLENIFSPFFQQLLEIISRGTSLEEAVSDVYDLYAQLFAAKGERFRPFMAREIAVGAPHVGDFFTTQAPQILDLWRDKILAYAGRDDISDRQIELAVYSIMIGIVSNFLMRPVFTPIMEASGLSLYDRQVKDHVVQFMLGGLRARLSAAVDEDTANKGEFS